MPYPEKGSALCDIDDNGNVLYPPTSPTDTATSEAMGLPEQGAAPWTAAQSQPLGSSSAVKPSQTRQRRRGQMPKKPYFDTSSNDGIFDEKPHDDQGRGMQVPRNAASVPPAPFDNLHNLDQSSPSKALARHGIQMDERSPIPPPSGQNAFFSMAEDGEDQVPMHDADKSPTPKPSRLTSSRLRRIGEASDMPAPSKPARVASSPPRGLRDTTIIDELPKKKGIPEFSSAPASIADSIDEELPQEVPQIVRGKNAVSFHGERQAKSVEADRRKSVPKPSGKVKLSALDLEDDEEFDGPSDDPFDQANIPLSRGVSPGPLKRKPRQAPKKEPIAKSSKASPSMKKPSTRGKAAAKSAKPSPSEKFSARTRQKAKPSAADSLRQSAATGCSEDNGNDEYFSGDHVDLVSEGVETHAAPAGAPALGRPTKATRKVSPASQKDVVSISSATESEDFDTIASDGDEYVDESTSKTMLVNKQPPKTRSTVNRAKNRNGVSTTSKNSYTNKKGDKKESGEAKEHELGTKSLPSSSTKTVACRTSVAKPEPVVRSQLEERSTVIKAPSPPQDEKIVTQKRRSSPKEQSSPGESEETPSISKSTTRQVKRAKATQPRGISRDTNRDQMDSVSTVISPSEHKGPQTRATRRSRPDQSQNDPGPSTSKATTSKKQAKHSENAMDASSKKPQGERGERTADVKDKDRKANIISFGAGGPKNNGKSRTRPTVAGHQSEQQGSGTSKNSKASTAAEVEHNPKAINSRLQKRDESEAQSAGPSVMPLAQHALTQQPSSEIKNRVSAVDLAVGVSPSSINEHFHGSRASQNQRTEMARKLSSTLEVEEDGTHSPPTRRPDDGQRPNNHFSIESNTTQGNKYADANDEVDSQFADDPANGLDGLLIPDSLEQRDDIEDSASVSQLRDAAEISNLLGQGIREGANKRKRALLEERASQTPLNEQPGSRSSVDSSAPQIPQQSGHQIPIGLLPNRNVSYQQGMIESERVSGQQSIMAQQPKMTAEHPTVHQHLKASQQPILGQQHMLNRQAVDVTKPTMGQLPGMMHKPAWRQRSTMSQQPMMIKQPVTIEQRKTSPMTGESQGALNREADYHQLPSLKNFSQPGIGKDSAKMYLQTLSTNFQRPPKRAKIDMRGLDTEPPLSTSNKQFCEPANGFSSDDVFAPEKFSENIEIDHGVVDQLRGIGSMKHPAELEAETQRPIEQGHELPRQRPGTRVQAQASHLCSMQNIGQDIVQDENTDETSESDLCRRGMMSRWAGVLPSAKQKEQVVVEEPEPYETVEDVMHRIVACVLRALHSRESAVNQVVDDYRTGGGRIVESIAATHANERKQLTEEHENRRLEYIQVCQDARRQIGLIGASLQDVDVGNIVVREAENKTLDLLKSL